MRRKIHELGRWSALALAGLIVQHWFHGLDLGASIWPVGVLLVLACGVFVITWDRFPFRVVRRGVDDRRHAVPTVVEHLPQQPQLGEVSEYPDAAASRRHARVVRANVQLVIDELAEARRVISESLDDGWVFWDTALTWDNWDNVKTELAPEEGFHAAYNATRDAWQALRRVEINRLERRGEGSNPYEIKTWESRRIETALELAESAQAELLQFLEYSRVHRRSGE
jgi:hypothetical protein